jgi:hypothetical protein
VRSEFDILRHELHPMSAGVSKDADDAKIKTAYKKLGES